MPEIIKKFPNRWNVKYGDYFILFPDGQYLVKGGKLCDCHVFGDNFDPFYFKTLSAAKSALRAYQRRTKSAPNT